MAGHVHVTAKEFYDIFGDSDEENDGEEENPDDYGSDLDLNVLADEEELDSKNDTIVTLNKALVKFDNKNNELQSESKFIESKFQSRINELDNDNKKLLEILASNHLMLGNMKSSLDKKKTNDIIYRID